MGTRQDAQEILQKLRRCRSKSFFGKIDESQKGIGFVLAYLENSSGEVIAGDLAREMNVSTARIAALLKKMEKSGLITRCNSPEDARKTVVRITPAGIAYAEEIKEQILEKVQLLLEKVGREDIDEFIRISHKIKDALNE